jgi:hypothetical protein
MTEAACVRARLVRLSLSGALGMALFVGAPALGNARPPPDLVRFQFEQQAQNHCPGEDIVWLDPRSQTFAGSTGRFYGMTKKGAFACRREAENAGYSARSR